MRSHIQTLFIAVTVALGAAFVQAVQPNFPSPGDAGRHGRRASKTVTVDFSGQTRTQGENIAVLITGVQDRFLWNSKMENLLKPLVEQGYGVDFFIQLVEHGSQSGASWGNVKRTDSHDLTIGNIDSLRQAVKDAGGRICILELIETDNKICLPTEITPDLLKHMSQYPPSTEMIGLNVLRRFSSLAQLLNKSKTFEQQEQFQYKFVLVTRDDDYWLQPLSLSSFSLLETDNVIYTRNCKTWGGLNDKTFLMGHTAAHALLPKFVPGFWWHDTRLEVWNAERVLAGMVNVLGISSHPVPFEQIPTAEARYEADTDGSVQLCLSPIYLCANVSGSPAVCSSNL